MDKKILAELQSIDTKGTQLILSDEGKMQIHLDKRVTQKAFSQVLEYLYTDRISWDKETEKPIIQETKEAANYLGLSRLEAICETYLDTTKNVGVPESTWWKNMKWAYENLRSGPFDMTDLTLICKEKIEDEEGKEVDTKTKEVKCHAVILTAACKYFHGMLLGDVDNNEKKTMRIEIDDCSEKQMEAILKYIYTREFDVELDDVIGVWILSNKFLLEDLQVECESLIMKNISKENVDDIKKIAEVVQSKRVLELCNDVIERNKNKK